MTNVISKKIVIISTFGILSVGILMTACTKTQKPNETWKQYEDNIISFQYPADYSIKKMPNNYLQAINSKNEEVMRLTYLNVQDATYLDIWGYKKTSFEDLKKGWLKTNTKFFEIQISDKDVLVSIYKMGDGKLRFGHIVKYGKYFWGLDYYEKSNQSPDYYLTNKIIPEIPRKIIESAILKIKPVE